jgi:RimJ/RimL family protein N-acetyltransferase
VTEWALEDVGLHRLELEHSTHNLSSCRVAEKAGYRWESTKRSQAKHQDGWHDMHLHVRLEQASSHSASQAGRSRG